MFKVMRRLFFLQVLYLIGMILLATGNAFWVGTGWTFHLRDLAILSSLGYFVIYTIQLAVGFCGEEIPLRMVRFRSWWRAWNFIVQMKVEYLIITLRGPRGEGNK